MKHKGSKIHNRIRKIRDDTLLNLFNKIPHKCKSCRYNFECPQLEKMNDISSCDNYVEAIEVNKLIEMLNFQNINLQHFADKNGLKIEFLRLMLKGKLLIPYKYYVKICTRCRVEEFDEFFDYVERFSNNNI